jgi:hypothetical protein
LYLDVPSGKWIYEAFNHVFASDKFQSTAGDIGQMMAQIYHKSENELVEQAIEIKEAR